VKVQSQVDLSMKSIQVLQKEQVLLLQSVTNPVSSGFTVLVGPER
jgi:hypothetical protein